jgi:predicted amidohydrolase
MIAAAVQTRPVFGEKEKNLNRALDLMKPVKADLFLLPELFTTGYLFESKEELKSMAEPLKGFIFDALSEFTKRKGITLFAGFAECCEDKIFNSSLLLSRGELIAHYRKLHLFKEEKAIFDEADNDPMVLESEGAKLGLMICFDWIFPEMARTLALKGAQVLCLSANLVLPWCQQAMITRSLENSVFSILSNRVGTEEHGGRSLTFTGMSEIINPRGEILSRASKDKEEVIVAEIDPAEADDKMVTPTNHVLYDRRPDRYSL